MRISKLSLFDAHDNLKEIVVGKSEVISIEEHWPVNSEPFFYTVYYLNKVERVFNPYVVTYVQN